jgi:hypothetical protein
MPRINLFSFFDRDQPKVLNEKEIQEKLYGHYRKGTVPKKTSVQQGVSAQKLELLPPVAEKIRVTEQLHDGWRVMVRVSRETAEKIPWRFMSVVAGVLLCSFFVFQFASTFMEHTNLNGLSQKRLSVIQRAEVKAKQSPVTNALENPLSYNAALPEVVDTDESALSMQIAEREQTDLFSNNTASLIRMYAVQVCTYQREDDAARLTGELKTFNFDAFYKAMQSRGRRLPYYVVFLGQDENFAGAQALLKEFKNTSLFSDFSDSFIRSL